MSKREERKVRIKEGEKRLEKSLNPWKINVFSKAKAHTTSQRDKMCTTQTVWSRSALII